MVINFNFILIQHTNTKFYYRLALLDQSKSGSEIGCSQILFRSPSLKLN